MRQPLVRIACDRHVRLADDHTVRVADAAQSRLHAEHSPRDRSCTVERQWGIHGFDDGSEFLSIGNGFVLPWWCSRKAYLVASALLLGWPWRILLEFNSMRLHLDVKKVVRVIPARDREAEGAKRHDSTYAGVAGAAGAALRQQAGSNSSGTPGGDGCDTVRDMPPPSSPGRSSMRRQVSGDLGPGN
jgi:hypothetical protein